MAIEFETQTTDFSGSDTMKASFSFRKNILNAQVALQGFDLTFGNNDHQLNKDNLKISNVTFGGNTVSYDINLEFRDCTGHYMYGSVTALIIAVTE